MIPALCQLIEWVLLLSIPRADRECLLGDMNEEFGGPGGGRLGEMFRIACHFHLEPYRDRDRSAAALGLLAIGLGLLWVIPVATLNMFVDPTVLSSPLVRLSVALWGAPHITAAIATGLLVGRTPLLGQHGPVIKVHIGLVLCVALVLSSPVSAATLTAIALLLSTMFIGHRAQRVIPVENG